MVIFTRIKDGHIIVTNDTNKERWHVRMLDGETAEVAHRNGAFAGVELWCNANRTDITSIVVSDLMAHIIHDKDNTYTLLQ